jgi:GT2 family glycosyltransferase
MKKEITVLIPTYNRLKALAVTLTSLYYQTEKDFDIVVSDQSPDYDVKEDGLIKTIVRLLEAGGHTVTILKNLPARGMAQQRQFLLEQSLSPYSLFMDDDLILEPYVLKNMKLTLQKQGCGFAGCAVIGLSYQQDVRPHQQNIEFWESGVVPETILPKGVEWERYMLHNAANVYHLEQKHKASPDNPLPYKVAWVGGCSMYDTQKLREVGGFSFWKDLPEKHCGEDVLAQLRVMKKYGGCGILPSGVYHQELETTVTDRKVNAPEYLEI